MDAAPRGEIGDLLFTNVGQGIDGTVGGSRRMENPSFKDALEMFCYRNNVHKIQNPAALFYMILGYLSTYPQSKQFERQGMKDMYLSVNEQTKTLKVAVGYQRKRKATDEINSLYKVFVMNVHSGVPTKRLDISDYEGLDKAMSKGRTAMRPYLRTAFERVEYVTVKRPGIGTIYDISTDDGKKKFSANQISPFVVETEVAPLSDKREYVDRLYHRVLEPEKPRKYMQLIEDMPNIFQKTVDAFGARKTPENLLYFTQGALEFNYKANFDLKITPDIHFFNKDYNRLFVLEMQKDKWLSIKKPVTITAKAENIHVTQKDDVHVPTDFNYRRYRIDVVDYHLLNQGPIVVEKRAGEIDHGRHIIKDLFDLLEAGKQSTRITAPDISPMVRTIESDLGFFSTKNDQPRSKFFANYILGQLLAHSGEHSRSLFAYSFTNADPTDNRVSFVFRESHTTTGVAIHILGDSSNGATAGGTFLTPDYTEVGVNGKILNVYIDCREIRLTADHQKNLLSRLPANSITAEYSTSRTVDDIDIMGEFKRIRRDKDLSTHSYSLITKGRDFVSTIADGAKRAGLAPQNSADFEMLVKSFCLAIDRRGTFLPYPKNDPGILGVKSSPDLPTVLMKIGVAETSIDATQKRMLDDLRAVYMGDQVYAKKEQVVLRAVSTTSPGAEIQVHGILEEYTNGAKGHLYDVCAGHASSSKRLKRQGYSFCRSTRSNSKESLKIGRPSEDIIQKHKAFRNRMQYHAAKVEQFSSTLMQTMMMKNVLGALMEGNYEEVAINVGFLVGSPALGYAAQYVAARGTSLAARGAKVVGTSLRMAAPFLNRVTSAFVAYDLYKQVEAYNHGDTDAMVGIVGDSVVLAIDVAIIAVEILEILGIVQGISSTLGPIGAAIGLSIFIGVDIHRAVRTVEKIDSIIKLTQREKGDVGIQAFLHSSPEKYLLRLMEQKQLNNAVAQSSISVLKDLDQFKIYGAPLLMTCKPVKSLNRCMDGYKEVGNNKADFTKLERFESRTWPDMPSGFRTICGDAQLMKSPLFPRGRTVEKWLLEKKPSTEIESKEGLQCYGFQTIYDENPKNGTKAFLNAGSGNDSIVGFQERSNVISFSSGRKSFTGGNKPDTFILHGEDIAMGFIDGGMGTDTLDFSKYAKPESNIEIFNGALSAHMFVVSGTNYRLDIDNIENFIGRPDARDKIITNCRTSFVNFLGGTESLSDIIRISQSSNPKCEYRLVVVLWQNTNVLNFACNGMFSYELSNDTKSGQISLQSFCTDNNTALSVVKVNKPLRSVLRIQKLQDKLEMQVDTGILLSVVNFNLEQTYFLFDDFRVQVSESGIMGIQRLPVIENSSDAIQSLLDLSHLNAFLVMEDQKNQTKIMMGRAQDVQQNMAKMNVLRNDANFEHSILISGNDTENIFRIDTVCMQRQASVSRNPTNTTIYLAKDQKSDIQNTLDLSGVYQLVKSHNATLNITIELISQNELLLNLWAADQSSEQYQLGVVTIYNFEKHILEKQFTVMLNVPFHFDYKTLTLKPAPLSFPKNIKIIILQPDDITEFTTVKLAKTMDDRDFLTVLKSNGTHAIITNMMNPNLKRNEDNLFTLFLTNYYKSEINARLFDTLKLKFEDGSIKVGKFLKKRRNDMLDFQDFRDILEKLSKM